MKYQINSKGFDEILIALNNTINDELIPLIRDMKNITNHENWQGKGANSFDIRYNHVMDGINTIPMKLLIVQKYLDQALNDYSDTHQTLAQMFQQMEDELDALAQSEGDFYGKI